MRGSQVRVLQAAPLLLLQFQLLSRSGFAMRSFCRPRWSQSGHSEGRVMASIRKHRNKWQVQVRRVGHPPVSRSFIQRADAMAWARQVGRKIDGGELVVDPRVLSRLLVRDLLIRYRDTITPSKRSAKVESYKIDQILRYNIANCSLRGLTPPVIALDTHHVHILEMNGDSYRLNQSQKRRKSPKT